MKSKEALEKIKEKLFLTANDYVKTFIPCILKITQDLERLENLEKENESLQSENKKLKKELKQTKSNFKNSQTHSKNCYKKLKNDMIRLIKIIKDYSLITDYDISWGVVSEDEEFLRKILK